MPTQTKPVPQYPKPRVQELDREGLRDLANGLAGATPKQAEAATAELARRSAA